MARSHLTNVFLIPAAGLTDLRFDKTTLVKYGAYEIELNFFDDMGPAPVAFVVRLIVHPGLDKFSKFVVRDTDGGFSADVLRTTRIWYAGYFGLMPLDDFLKKTLG